MKNYVCPELKVIGDTMEGVYAASGWKNPPATPTPIPYIGWDIHCEYRNHNSGSHSEVAIIALNTGSMSGDKLTMSFQIKDFKLDYVKDSSGYQVTNVSENGFTIVRPGHFNPGERIEFNIQIVVKDSKYHGSVGVTGEYYPCNIVLSSLLVA